MVDPEEKILEIGIRTLMERPKLDELEQRILKRYGYVKNNGGWEYT